MKPAGLDIELPPGANFSAILPPGSSLAVTDLEGGANVSLLLYRASNPLERLCLPDTLKAQHIARLTAGDALFSDMGRVLATVAQDSCGWHDPLCGPIGAETVRERWGESSFQERGNAFLRNARDGLLIELAKHGLGRRDLVPTLNLFSRVQVQEDGTLRFLGGASPAGSRVVLRAELDVLAVLCCAPHPLDPAPEYPARRVRLETRLAPTPPTVLTPRAESERGMANTLRALAG